MDSTNFSFLANGPQANSTFRESSTFPEQSLSSINDVSTFSNFDLTPLDETQEDESRTSVSLDSFTALRLENYQKALDLVKENAMLKEELNNVAPVNAIQAQMDISGLESEADDQDDATLVNGVAENEDGQVGGYNLDFDLDDVEENEEEGDPNEDSGAEDEEDEGSNEDIEEEDELEERPELLGAADAGLVPMPMAQNNAGKKKSPIWDYFVENELTMQAKCLYCDKKFACHRYRRRNMQKGCVREFGNLCRHIERRHNDLIDELNEKLKLREKRHDEILSQFRDVILEKGQCYARCEKCGVTLQSKYKFSFVRNHLVPHLTSKKHLQKNIQI